MLMRKFPKKYVTRALLTPLVFSLFDTLLEGGGKNYLVRARSLENWSYGKVDHRCVNQESPIWRSTVMIMELTYKEE